MTQRTLRGGHGVRSVTGELSGAWWRAVPSSAVCRLIVLLCVAWLGACGDASGGGAEQAPDAANNEANNEGGDEADNEGGDGVNNAAGVACETGVRQSLVLRKVTFGRATSEGVSVGRDIDGVDSDIMDEQGCRQSDFVDEEGATGIDNQFARLLPGLEAVGGEAIEGIIQGSINTGEILLMLHMEHLDDLQEDACIDVTLFQGQGSPEIGTDDLISPGQTFEPDTTQPMARIEEVGIEGGRLEAGPFEFSLPILVFGFDLVFNIRNAMVRADFEEDGSATGFISGSIDVAELLELVGGISGGGQVVEVLLAVLDSSADLFPDENGDCTEISITLEFEGVTAFLFEDTFGDLNP